ncbi:MAG: hypothetical protein P9M07_08640 [Candidatus Aceula meridiana]|nr:hypothetical protein [Candidatus Aceula meridiana]
MTEKTQEQEHQDSQSPKKILPKDQEQVSFKEYEDLRKREIEKRKKKKKAPPIVNTICNIFYFILAAIGLFFMGYFAFAMITTPAK